MKDIYIIECKEEKDRNSGFDLLNRTFPNREFSGVTTQEILVWHGSSIKHKPLMVCAKHKDQVVSVACWIPWIFLYEDRKYLGYQSCEGATEKEFRGQGVWRNVIRFGEELLEDGEVDFFFGFPSRFSYYPLCEAGYHPIGNFKFSVRIVNPLKRRAKGNDEFESDNLPVNNLIEKNKITPEITLNYFKWRYLESPKAYEFVRYKERNNEALFVVRKTKYYNRRYRIKVNELLILDCQFKSFHQQFVMNAFKYLESRYSGSVFQLRTFFNQYSDRGVGPFGNAFIFTSGGVMRHLSLSRRKKEIEIKDYCLITTIGILCHM